MPAISAICLPAERPASRRAALARRLALALGVAVIAGATLLLRDPLASMASYCAGLMALSQLAPPLLLLGLPRRARPGMVAIFDPWIAFILFAGLSIAVSLPGLLDPTLSNALYAAPLGLLELVAGLLFWGQIVPATRPLRAPWAIALLAWAGSLPMTVVALVWMLSAEVLYTPYLDVICRWDIPPLLDQKWAGFVMFVAGVPMQFAAAWVLVTAPAGRSPEEPEER